MLERSFFTKAGIRNGRIAKHVTKMSIKNETNIRSILYGRRDMGVVSPIVIANESRTYFVRPAVMKESWRVWSRSDVQDERISKANISTGIIRTYDHNGFGRREAFLPANIPAIATKMTQNVSSQGFIAHTKSMFTVRGKSLGRQMNCPSSLPGPPFRLNPLV